METSTVSIDSRTDVRNAIYERRSIRKYQDKALNKKLVEEIIQAGRMAPSAMNKQPWSFYVVSDRQLIKELSKSIIKASFMDFAKSGIRQMVRTASDLYHAARHADLKSTDDPVFHGAQTVVFITAPKEDEWAMIDVGMCAQNMLLMAHSLGIGGCPIGFAKLVEHAKSYPKLRIPDGEHVVLAIILGFPDEVPEVHPRRRNNVFFLQEMDQ
ncbi:MAG: nitroreductase family protein [Bacteroidota bacterium]